MRTRGSFGGHIENQLICGGMGVAGESGEVCDYIKKIIFHGHELDKNKIIKECGDVLWYIALIADGINVDMDTIAQTNINKLKARYPDGFDEERSKNRSE
jgi:NTP pyrophosphatase (non-canonical NTP hydrolase)